MSEAQDFEPVHLPSAAAKLQRWNWQTILAVVLVGAISACAAAAVRGSFRALQWMLTGSSADPPLAAAHLSVWRRCLTPILGAALATLVLWIQRAKAGGCQPEAYVEYVAAVRHHDGVMSLAPNCWRTVSAAFSVATGAAVGREGSMIQFAATVASAIRHSKLLTRKVESLGLLVACGVAAGVTAAYNAPLSGAFFAAEIVLGRVEILELPLLGLASAVGWLVSGPLLGWGRLYPARVLLTWGWSLGFLLPFAAAVGFVGPVYQWLLARMHRLHRLPLALLFGGAVVGCLSILDPRVWGNGDEGLRTALRSAVDTAGAPGAQVVSRVLILRLCATLACVWTGTVGGVFTPTLFLGGALGALFAHVLPGPVSALWVVAGMSLMMAAVTHAPLMATCIALELTGEWKLVWVLLPANYLCWRIAHGLSPRAMYAIASQAPQHGGGMSATRQRR